MQPARCMSRRCGLYDSVSSPSRYAISEGLRNTFKRSKELIFLEKMLAGATRLSWIRVQFRFPNRIKIGFQLPQFTRGQNEIAEASP